MSQRRVLGAHRGFQQEFLFFQGVPQLSHLPFEQLHVVL